MGEGGGRGLPAVRLSIWGLRGSVRGKGEGGGVWGCVGGPAHAYPLLVSPTGWFQAPETSS